MTDEVRTMAAPERFEPEMPGDLSALAADDADEIVSHEDGVDAGDDDAQDTDPEETPDE